MKTKKKVIAVTITTEVTNKALRDDPMDMIYCETDVAQGFRVRHVTVYDVDLDKHSKVIVFVTDTSVSNKHLERANVVGLRRRGELFPARNVQVLASD